MPRIIADRLETPNNGELEVTGGRLEVTGTCHTVGPEGNAKRGVHEHQVGFEDVVHKN